MSHRQYPRDVGSNFQTENIHSALHGLKKVILLRTFLKNFVEGTISPLFVYGNFQMEAIEEIRTIAEGKLKDSSQFIVDVIVSSKRKPQKVTVVVDGDAGISIDDCADISREVSKVLDESNVLTDSYVLEVTTPGLDQPLKLHRQYKKNIGRKVRTKVSDKVVEGKLVAVSESGIAIEQGDGKKIEKSVVELKFSEIDKTIVLVSFK